MFGGVKFLDAFAKYFDLGQPSFQCHKQSKYKYLHSDDDKKLEHFLITFINFAQTKFSLLSVLQNNQQKEKPNILNNDPTYFPV